MFIHIAHHWLSHELTLNQDLIPGDSPNRSLRRTVIEDVTDGVPYVLEAVSPEKAPKRLRQARVLQILSDHGCSHLAPWLPLPTGEFGLYHHDLFWQLRRFVKGTELPRETYGNDGWRGKVLADFLTDLQHAPATITEGYPRFSLSDYIRSLIPRIRQKLPELVTDLTPIWNELKGFAQAEASLPVIAAHGDFHPHNAIWNDRGLEAVIDWEFFGPKADGYDAANLLGCLGMDDPAFLTAPMTMTFLKQLVTSGSLSAQALYWLPDFIVALRFAWMREWVWFKDRDMMIQELDFMWLVLDNRDLLRSKWSF